MSRCLFILVLFTLLFQLSSLAIAEQLDSGECSSLNNCSINAVCKNTTGTVQCTCKSGFTGDGYDCEDINECESPSYRKCSGNAMCLNLLGSYTCTCDEGWTGDGFTCSDVDECELGTDECSSNGTCFNQIGTYSCLCQPGYYGNGYFCYDIDECADISSNNCSRRATCHNTVPGFYCECNDGYEGNGYSCTESKNTLETAGTTDEVSQSTDTKSSNLVSTPVIIGCTVAGAAFLAIGLAVGLTVRSRRRRHSELDATIATSHTPKANALPYNGRQGVYDEESNIGTDTIKSANSSGKDSGSGSGSGRKVAFERKTVLDEEIYSDPESYSDETDSDTSDSGSDSDQSEIETELSSSENKRVNKP